MITMPPVLWVPAFAGTTVAVYPLLGKLKKHRYLSWHYKRGGDVHPFAPVK
mgnify:CR=1 FL=1